MSDREEEIPQSQLGHPESLGPVSTLNRHLYMAVILVLGLVLLGGVVGWMVLASNDHTFPDGLGVILGTVAGALVALVSDKSEK
jgi:hypothetical protein